VENWLPGSENGPQRAALGWLAAMEQRIFIHKTLFTKIMRVFITK
jgi:hypothetical protein